MDREEDLAAVAAASEEADADLAVAAEARAASEEAPIITGRAITDRITAAGFGDRGAIITVAAAVSAA